MFGEFLINYLSCEEKVIRKGVGNVTKNGKALLAKIHEICGEEIWVSVQVASVKIKRM